MERPILVTEPVESRYAGMFERAAPGVPRVVLGSTALPEGLEEVEAVYFSGDLYPDGMGPFLRALKEVRSLGWLHSFSAGIDNVFFQRLLERGARLTTSSGAHAVPIAQTVMLYLLASSRDLPGWLAEQQRHVWKPRSVRDLQGRVLGVVGLGPIGQEVARLGSALRMQVIGVRREPRGDEPCETWELARLPELLARADYLVLALPLTDETRHLIDARALARMKREAFLVNVGRGELVDERALTDALASGALAGAGLDVFEVEPLPETSALWDLPNVIITPHSSGTSTGNLHRATEIFVDNLGRYVRGESLRNEVVATRARG
jgi:phosphoglycerate dehydrogenase-like enzyme